MQLCFFVLLYTTTCELKWRGRLHAQKKREECNSHKRANTLESNVEGNETGLEFRKVSLKLLPGKRGEDYSWRESFDSAQILCIQLRNYYVPGVHFVSSDTALQGGSQTEWFWDENNERVNQRSALSK